MAHMTISTAVQPGVRGAVDHELRARIIAAAEARFRHYGYNKTTVADIASDLNISPAYIYKFYASKIAICEAILDVIVGRIDTALLAIAREDVSASERLRKLYRSLLDHSVMLYFKERKLHDMILAGLDMRWQAVERLKDAMRTAARTIVEDGRARGEFESRTPIGDVVDAIWISLVPFAHPSVLSHLAHDHDLAAHARHIADLALRGLAKS